MRRVVCIGGGTGLFVTLSGLKKYKNLHLSAIVSMTDSGGSNRVLRDEFGLLPTSDIRQCIVALASEKSSGLLRDLFTYRYNQGIGISGMTFGNLFMAALSDIYGSQEKAISETCKLFDVKGEIIPVTYDNSHLVARYENGRLVMGEHFIDEPAKDMGRYKIVELTVFPKARPNPKALTAIKQASIIVIGPGDLYTSILANLVIPKISESIRKSKAKKLFIVNLMTKFGQTNHFGARQHLEVIENHIGKGTVDYCLVNKSKKPEIQIIKRYKEEGSDSIKDDLGNPKRPKIIRKNLVSKTLYKKPKSDFLVRSLIRHDSKKLAKEIVALL